MTTATLTRDTTFTVQAEPLAAAAAIIGKVAGTSAGINLASLAFRDQRLVLSATDFEMSASFKLPVKGKRAKAVAVNARMLATTTGKLSGAVQIVVDDEKVKLTDELGVEYELPVATGTTPLPLGVDATFTDPVAIDMELFRETVKRIAFAASADTARPILTSLYFMGDGTAVATDSYRLAITRNAPAIEALIPAPAAALACKALPAEEETTVTFNASRTSMVLQSGSVTFSVRLIDGQYPNWKQLMPASLDSYGTVMVDRRALAAAVGKVAVVASDKNVPVRISVEDGKMALKVISQDVAISDADVAADGVIPNVAMNPTYLGQALKAIDDELVAISAVDNLKPMLITDGSTDSPWTVLQMPVRVP